MLLPKMEFQMIEETDSEDDDDEFEEPTSELDSDSNSILREYVIVDLWYLKNWTQERDHR